jgi:uncharacterized membrane protein YhhN
MILLLILYFLIAILDWLAVAKGWKKVEYVAKPSAMLVLLGPLAFLARFGSIPLICFSLGIFFSLVGDVFLMLSYGRSSDRWFLPGLVAFLMVHVSYIIGLNIPSPGASPLWSFGLGILLALSAARLLRQILAGVTQKGLGSLVRPVALYGLTITLMLLSALLTFFSSWWNVYAAVLVASGAILFYFSDALLAWNKFVRPLKNGPVINMVFYHLGQLALVAGVILQFGK